MPPRTYRDRASAVVTAALCAVAFCGCRREERPISVDPPHAVTVSTAALTELAPGPAATQPALTAAPAGRQHDYEQMAYALAEGKQLYRFFNCIGCHGHGGGGMGPALMDADWLYGSTPDEVFASIALGRPNGMPAFGRRLPEYYVWQLVAYVRSMSGLVRQDAAPGRSEHMMVRPPEHSIDEQTPRPATQPAETRP